MTNWTETYRGAVPPWQHDVTDDQLGRVAAETGRLFRADRPKPGHLLMSFGYLSEGLGPSNRFAWPDPQEQRAKGMPTFRLGNDTKLLN